jgi:hypothetical protein
MTSSELLSQIQTCNWLLGPVAKPEPEPGEERTQEDYPANNIPAPSTVSAQEEHIELLTDKVGLCNLHPVCVSLPYQHESA